MDFQLPPVIPKGVTSGHCCMRRLSSKVLWVSFVCPAAFWAPKRMNWIAKTQNQRCPLSPNTVALKRSWYSNMIKMTRAINQFYDVIYTGFWSRCGQLKPPWQCLHVRLCVWHFWMVSYWRSYFYPQRTTTSMQQLPQAFCTHTFPCVPRSKLGMLYGLVSYCWQFLCWR